MANPFSSNPFNPNLFPSEARQGSDELGPDEIAPGKYAPSSPTYQTFGQSNTQSSDGRRSTELGPDEIAPGQLAPTSPSYATFAAASAASAPAPSRTSAELGPDEIAPGQFAPSSPSYNIKSPGDRRSTNIGPDELGPLHPAPSTPSWRTFAAGDRRSTNIGPDEIVPTQSPFASPNYKSSEPSSRQSTKVGPHEIGPNPTPFATPNYVSSAAGSRESSKFGPDEIILSKGPFATPNYKSPPANRKSTKVGPYELASKASPFATPDYASSTPGDRKSTKLGPDEIVTDDSPFATPDYESSNPGNRKSTRLGPYELVPEESPLASPDYQSSEPSDRKSTKHDPYEMVPMGSPFSSPDYKTPGSDKRNSTKYGPDEIPTNSSFTSPSYRSPTNSDSRKSTRYASDEMPANSPFTSPSYKSSNKSMNRRSTNIGPNEGAPSQSTMQSWRKSKMVDRRSVNFAPDESSSQPTATPAWRTFDAGDRRSTNIGPDESVPPSHQSSVNVMTAGIPEDGPPFSSSTSDEENSTSTPKTAPEADSSDLSQRASRNFSKRFVQGDLPTIVIPPIESGEDGKQVSPAMQDTPMRDTFRSTSLDPERAAHPKPRSRPVSMAFGLPSVEEKPTLKARPVSVAFDLPSVEEKPAPKTRPVSVAFDLPSVEEKPAPKTRPVSVAFDLPSSEENPAPSAHKPSRLSSTAAPPSAMASRRASSAALGGPRRSSVSVTNVVIPAHLLTHIETNWQEDKVVGRRKSAYRREDTRASFNVQQMAQQQQEEVKNIIGMTPNAPRSKSISMEALANADPFAVVRSRNASGASKRVSRGKSLAAVTEDEKAGQNEKADEDEKTGQDKKAGQDEEEEKDDDDEEEEIGGQGLTPWGNFTFQVSAQGSVSPAGRVDPMDPWDNAGAALAQGNTASATGSISAEPPRRRSIWRHSQSADPNAPNNGERRGTIFQRAGSVFQDTITQVKKKVRRSSMWDLYDNAKKRQIELRRKKWVQVTFEYCFYAVLVLLVYFLIIGVPLWKGSYWELYLAFKYKLNVTGTWSVVIIVAVLYAYSPLFILFEPDPPMPEPPYDPYSTANVQDTALMIPCYKAASLIGATLEAATKVFPPENIFVVANGNSPTPLDETEEVCRPYGVNHIWSPVGSKIVAQFVGCYAAKDFKNVLLIDDDCALPPNFPIVSDRLKGKVMCIGYTIKSVGPESSRGTFCQQAQDLEYKISGIQRALAGKIGSATFPHGAISLWDREFLIKTFNKHPGFSVSEDWFFGHVARQLGCRTQMATSVFIETETPPAVFFSSGGARGGFGEMTVFKQRFMRWNFFFVNGMYYNLHYILFSWKLGWWELGTKLFVFQEIYETLLYLATPLVVPVSLVVRPQFFFELLALTFVLYFLNALIFNELHLRRKNERVPWKCVWLYYMPYKLVLTFVNVASCYWAIYKYATYFANRHPKIIEDEKAIHVVLQLEEEEVDEDDPVRPAGGRRMSVTAVGSQVEIPGGAPGGRRMTITAMGQRFSNPEITITEEEEEEESLVPKPQERKASITMVKTGEEPAPLDARRPSITIGGRRVSIGSATVIDEIPPASKSRRSSDAFQSKGVSTAEAQAEPTPRPSAGRRSSDTSQSKGLSAAGTGAATGPAKASRRRMSSAKRASFMNESVIEELKEEEEGEEESNEQEKEPNSSSRRSSKRKSQLGWSYGGPQPPAASEEPAPVVTDALMDRLQAIEDALNARGIGAVDFAIHDDSPAGTRAASVEDEDEDNDSNQSSPNFDEKKHADAQSMV